MPDASLPVRPAPPAGTDPAERCSPAPPTLAHLDAWHFKDWPRAAAGDPHGIFGFLLGLPSPGTARAYGYLALRDLGLSLPLLRPALTQVWSHDHAGLVATVGSGQVRRLFAELAFDMAHLSAVMTVYRGGLAPPSAPHVLARGFSWTLDQDVAAFFATRRWPLANPAAGGSGSPRPFVLATEITRGRVIHHDDGRQEAEVILRGRPGRFHILDDLDDILFRENRYCANKAQAQALALKSLAAKVPRHPTGG